ncbi:hypothetical protein Fmac_014357 [Flemingia macrophylla]|uniref:Secreted protein n=1 Tax=Flemingia macrophylla TaxID=520843 RepID=A0ABD1MBI0_9FABA
MTMMQKNLSLVVRCPPSSTSTSALASSPSSWEAVASVSAAAATVSSTASVICVHHYVYPIVVVRYPNDVASVAAEAVVTAKEGDKGEDVIHPMPHKKG